MAERSRKACRDAGGVCIHHADSVVSSVQAGDSSGNWFSRIQLNAPIATRPQDWAEPARFILWADLARQGYRKVKG